MITSYNDNAYLVHVICIKDYEVNGNIEIRKDDEGFLKTSWGPAPMISDYYGATQFSNKTIAQVYIDNINSKWNTHFKANLVQAEIIIKIKNINE